MTDLAEDARRWFGTVEVAGAPPAALEVLGELVRMLDHLRPAMIDRQQSTVRATGHGWSVPGAVEMRLVHVADEEPEIDLVVGSDQAILSWLAAHETAAGLDRPTDGRPALCRQPHADGVLWGTDQRFALVQPAQRGAGRTGPRHKERNMKRLLTKSIVTGLLAGTMLAPTAAHAFPFNPIGIARGAVDMLAPTADRALPGSPIGAVRGVAHQLPVTPLSLTAHSKAAPELPAGVAEKATSAAGTIRETLPVDLDGLPLPVSAVTVPPMLPTPPPA